jgi:hypothetical protein
MPGQPERWRVASAGKALPYPSFLRKRESTGSRRRSPVRGGSGEGQGGLVRQALSELLLEAVEDEVEAELELRVVIHFLKTRAQLVDAGEVARG